MRICNEITPATSYTELLGIHGLTAEMVKLWRPCAKNIEGILMQNERHIKAIWANDEAD